MTTFIKWRRFNALSSELNTLRRFACVAAAAWTR
jgi:hypothetical protein